MDAAIRYDPARYRYEAARLEMCAREAMRAGRHRAAAAFMLRASQCRSAWWRFFMYETLAAGSILAIVCIAAAMVAGAL